MPAQHHAQPVNQFQLPTQHMKVVSRVHAACHDRLSEVLLGRKQFLRGGPRHIDREGVAYDESSICISLFSSSARIPSQNSAMEHKDDPAGALPVLAHAALRLETLNQC
mmetsp:Transcript_59880/g.104727  ORF Transcript_59880/g.104727 Transcript_59880/m.104727 type:complete len:109 (-) Transcript_59880:1372-1698(-)